MRPDSAGSRWETFQARAPLPEVRAIIRHGIARGTIRSRPRGRRRDSHQPHDGRQTVPGTRTLPAAVPGLDQALHSVCVRPIERRA
jgi:hypothetical protein